MNGRADARGVNSCAGSCCDCGKGCTTDGVAAPLAMQPVAWRYPIGGGRYAATTSEEEARRASTDGTVDALGIIPDGVLGKEGDRG